MRRRHFVDSWFFIARIDPFDTHHLQSGRLHRAIADDDLITHDAILAETLTYFSGFGARVRLEAVAAVRIAMRRMEVVSSSALFTAALDFYERRFDKEYSLVDSMSMVVMQERKIQHVLTNDHHFRQEGFNVLSDAP